MWVVGSQVWVPLVSFEASCVSGLVLGSEGTEINTTWSPWESRANGRSAVGQEASDLGNGRILSLCSSFGHQLDGLECVTLLLWAELYWPYN